MLVNTTSAFSTAVQRYEIPEGLTVLEIMNIVQPDPAIHQFGLVFVGEARVYREYWHAVKPKAGQRITVKIVPQGGGAVRIVAIVAIAVLAIVATVVTAGIAAPALGFAAGGLGAGILGGLAGAAVGLGGTLLVNTFLPAPVPKVAKDYGNTSQTYAITGGKNRADIWGKLPFIGGKMRTIPPYAAIPYRETLGGKIYWRALFAIGHGPLQIDEIRIGTTEISNFQGVEYEIRRGYWQLNNKGAWNPASGVFPANPEFGDLYTFTANGTIAGFAYKAGQSITYNAADVATNPLSWDIDQEKQLKLFGSDVYEDPLSAEVKHATPVVHTTQTNCDVASIDIVFDRGLVHLQTMPPGKPSTIGVAIRIEQSPAGADNWTTVSEIPVFGAQTSPMFWGHRWATVGYGAQSATKQYDIRVTRMSADFDESKDFGNFSWYSLKSEAYKMPLPKRGVCYLSMRVLSSGQLTGTLDEVNVTVRSQCKDYDVNTNKWVWRVTNSPAALFRHMLQHPSRLSPALDSQIDLDRLAYWDTVTRPTNRVFNGVFDAKTSLLDSLTDVTRVGRATLTLRDLKYSVAIDEPKTVPVRLFTPKNTWDYSGEITHGLIPNAYRISIKNEDRDWATDEIIVYDDGFDGDEQNLRVERVDWIGITKQQQAWAEGRFHIAQQRLRREIHKFKTDFEQLVVERGDLVAFQHDAIAVGSGAMRVISTTQTGDNTTSLTLDSGVTTYSGSSYGIRARRVVDGKQRTDLYKIASPTLQKVGATQQNYGNNTAIAVNFPSGLSSTNRLLGVCFFSSPNGTVATPAGWTPHRTIVNNDSKLYIYSKIYTSGDSTTVTFTPSGGATGDGIVGVVMGFSNAGSPVDFGEDGVFNSAHQAIPINHTTTSLKSGLVFAIGGRNAGYSIINPLVVPGMSWVEDADISEGAVGVLLGIQHANFSSALNIPDQEFQVSAGTGTSVSTMFILPATTTDFTTLVLDPAVPTADAPHVGDLVAFGVYESETLRLIVRDIIPRNDLSAEITCISAGDGIHDAEKGIIPKWDAGVTSPVPPPPTVISIVSDASVMFVTSSRSLITRVVFNVEPSTATDYSYTVYYKVSGTDGQWILATITDYTSSSVAITGPESNIIYDFRIIRKHDSFLTSAAVQVNGYKVVGRSAPPNPLEELSISAVGGQALLKWKLPDDLDVQNGGWIIFRHTPLFDSPVWANSVTVGRAVSGDQTHVYLPLMAGTYMAKVYDADALESEVTMVSTKQASLLTFVTEDDLQEHPTFAGTKTACEVVDDKLQLQTASFDTITDVDALSDWDSVQHYVNTEGVYHFASGMDFGTIKKVRLTLTLQVQAENILDEVDGPDLWDSTEDIDGTEGAPVDAEVWGCITDDNPSGSPVWSEPMRMNALEVECRAVGQIECRLTTNNPSINIQVIELGLKAERL